MPPSLTAFRPSPMRVSTSSRAEREQQRAVLTSLTRQHESAVFTYLFRRVRRSVNVESLTKEVFARLLSKEDLNQTKRSTRASLVELCQEVLADFTRSADPRDAAWTELCLELDTLARRKHAQAPAEQPARDLSTGDISAADQSPS